MKLNELVGYLNEVLQPEKFRDYCPNGLQVEGCDVVTRVVAGVTASQKLLDIAVDRGAQAILVHHGYFWKGESPVIAGMRRKRLATLLKNDISLIAYHLPLDAHPELGNNAQLAALCGWQAEGRFAEQEIGWWGRPSEPYSLADLGERIALALGRQPMVIGEADWPVRRLAWCSGGAQSYFEQAIALGIDAFVSGEISEPTVHLARECGVGYIAAGHHATERYGVRAVAAALEQKFGIVCEFVDVDNPV